MHHQAQPAAEDLRHDVLNAVERIIGMRNVIEQQQDARKRLYAESDDGQKTKRVKDVDVLRDPVVEYLSPDLRLDDGIQAVPYIEPMLYFSPHSFTLL